MKRRSVRHNTGSHVLDEKDNAPFPVDWINAVARDTKEIIALHHLWARKQEEFAVAVQQLPEWGAAVVEELRERSLVYYRRENWWFVTLEGGCRLP